LLWGRRVLGGQNRVAFLCCGLPSVSLLFDRTLESHIGFLEVPNAQMKKHSEDNPAKHKPKQKHKATKPTDAGGVKAKRLQRRLIVNTVLTTSFVALCGFLVSLHKDFSIAAIVCLWFFFITAAVCFVVEFTRFQGKKRTAYWIGGSLALFGSGLCLYLILWTRKPLPADAFTVSLDVGQPIEPARAFGTKLTLENQSPQPIYHVHCRLFWHDMSGAGRRFLNDIALINDIPRLKPHMKQAISVALLPHQPVLAPFQDKTFVDFEIGYTPQSWAHSKTDLFEFCVVKNESGNYVWLNSGEGRTVEEMRAEIMSRPSTPVESVPLLSLAVTGIEHIDPIVNGGHKLRLRYLLSNIGGTPATEVVAQWRCLDERSHEIYFWTNRIQAELLAKVLLPRAEQTNWTDFSDRTPPGLPSLVERTLAGNAAWFGQLNWKDTSGADFIGHVRSFFTNGQFQVRYLDLRSPYGEWTPSH